MRGRFERVCALVIKPVWLKESAVLEWLHFSAFNKLKQFSRRTCFKEMG